MFEKNIKLIDIQTIAVSLIVIIVSFLRIIPHIHNFSPVIALAIFGAFHYKYKSLSYGVPLLALWVSDILINNFIYNLSGNFELFYDGFYWQYLSYIIIIFISINFRNKKISGINIIYLTFLTSIIFFIITNFGFWLNSNLYSNNFNGLIQCYVAAIPFLKELFMELFSIPLYFLGFIISYKKKLAILRIRHISY